MRILVASASFAKNPLLLEELKGLGCVVSVGASNTREPRELTEGELLELSDGEEILLLGRTPLSRTSIEKLKPLRFVSTYGVGLDHIDRQALADHGVQLGWTPGVNRRAVAEMVLGVMLNHCRNLSVSHHRMQQDQWLKDGGVGLDGQTVGIIGMGAIGSELVRLLAPWDVSLMYHDIVDRTDRAGRAVRRSFEEILAASDVLTLHVPLTPLTHMMVNRETLKQVKKTALLINTSRGAVVDFKAAGEAVLANQIGGFAVDVYEKEPFLGSTWKHPHIYMTPHIGGNSKQAVQLMGRAAIAHIRTFLKNV